MKGWGSKTLDAVTDIEREQDALVQMVLEGRKSHAMNMIRYCTGGDVPSCVKIRDKIEKELDLEMK